jgi:alginate O-acetyltransferase complex protein AlgI
LVFSSPIFLFWFLPLVMLIYYAVLKPYRNYVLLFTSLVFYSWAEGKLVTIMLVSIGIDYLIGVLMGLCKGRKKTALLVAGVVANLSLLLFYKYANFFFLNYNNLAPTFGLQPTLWHQVIMPLGVSFFIFHGISYLVDVYRNKSSAQKNIFDLALYISFFPQLIAGPIIRYHDIDQQLHGRKESLALFESGVQRFIIGFAKKILIANNIGSVADYVFAIPNHDLSFGVSWVGVVCYTIQIYFDFSGYSDMAIGLGRMFGFKFLENFNYPYISKSITEFWTRWHISLSNWFKDYLFIPLGGSKKGVFRNYLNIMIVFTLMGFWHGAQWTCVTLGVLFAVVICLEKLFLSKLLKRLPPVVQIFYTIFTFMLILISVRAKDMWQLFSLWENLLGFGHWKTGAYPLQLLLSNEQIFWLILGILFSVPLHIYVRKIRWIKKLTLQEGYKFTYNLILIGVFFLSICYLAVSTYNPFIYFRF